MWVRKIYIYGFNRICWNCSKLIFARSWKVHTILKTYWKKNVLYRRQTKRQTQTGRLTVIEILKSPSHGCEGFLLEMCTFAFSTKSAKKKIHRSPTMRSIVNSWYTLHPVEITGCDILFTRPTIPTPFYDRQFNSFYSPIYVRIMLLFFYFF